MIVTKMIGGLGNQMFQYAAGMSAASKNKTNLIVDNADSKENKTHGYSLSVFNIKGEIKKTQELPPVDFKGIFLKDSLAYYRLKQYNYDRKFEEVNDNTYIEGFFQSEKFFRGVENEIRKEFTLKEEAKGRNLEMLAKIKACEAVSLHIRRGDYFDNWKNRIFHGVNLTGYYKKAVRHIISKVKNPVFFVFSDDQAWVKENFSNIMEFTPVDINGINNGHEDLRLMSACRHNIIANSTFSWWGAWLNANEDKIITAPKKWFNNPLINTADLIPEKWKRI